MKKQDIKVQGIKLSQKTKIAAWEMILIGSFAIISTIIFYKSSLLLVLGIAIFLPLIILPYFLLKRKRWAWIISVTILTLGATFFSSSLIFVLLYYIISKPVAWSSKITVFFTILNLITWVLPLILLLLDRKFYIAKKLSLFITKFILVATLIIFLLNVFVLGIAIFCYPEVFWETYENKEYNYEIKYPETWILEEFSSETVSIYSEELGEERALMVTSDPKIVEGIEKDMTTMENDSNLNVDIFKEQITINGNSGFKTTFTPLEDKSVMIINVFISKEGRTFAVAQFYPDSLETFNKILSTFRFID